MHYGLSTMVTMLRTDITQHQPTPMKIIPILVQTRLFLNLDMDWTVTAPILCLKVSHSIPWVAEDLLDTL